MRHRQTFYQTLPLLTPKMVEALSRWLDEEQFPEVVWCTLGGRWWEFRWPRPGEINLIQ